MDEHWIRLQRLPNGLVFPADLQERIHYDAENKRLVFRGFMTKSEYDRLTGLNDDFQYQRAVYQLFVGAGPDERWHLWFWIIVGLALGGIVWAIFFVTR